VDCEEGVDQVESIEVQVEGLTARGDNVPHAVLSRVHGRAGGAPVRQGEGLRRDQRGAVREPAEMVVPIGSVGCIKATSRIGAQRGVGHNHPHCGELQERCEARCTDPGGRTSTGRAPDAEEDWGSGIVAVEQREVFVALQLDCVQYDLKCSGGRGWRYRPRAGECGQGEREHRPQGPGMAQVPALVVVIPGGGHVQGTGHGKLRERAAGAVTESVICLVDSLEAQVPGGQQGVGNIYHVHATSGGFDWGRGC